MGRKIASQRGLNIHFEVADVCDLEKEGGQYDLIIDSYCLQCIVFDHERQQVFSAVKSRLKSDGYYLVSTAILDKVHEKMIGSDTLEASDTGTVYTKYGSSIIDVDTGIVLSPINKSAHDYPDAICIAEQWYLPSRRHLRSSELESELAVAGFNIVFRDEQHTGSLAFTLSN